MESKNVPMIRRPKSGMDGVELALYDAQERGMDFKPGSVFHRNDLQGNLENIEQLSSLLRVRQEQLFYLSSRKDGGRSCVGGESSEDECPAPGPG